MFFRTFSWSLGITALALVWAFLYDGVTGLVLVGLLAILEVSLSFDNAVINASVLERMSAFWQRIFLTIGIAIAVFGMRLVFPVVLVSVTAGLGPIEAFQLALDDPAQYQHTLEDAHPAIASYGGVFLLLIFLDFVFEEQEYRWLKPVESALAKIGKLDQLSVLVTLGALLLVAGTIADDPATVLTSGVAGIVTYLLVNGLGSLFESQGLAKAEDEDVAADKPAKDGNGQLVKLTGKAAFFLFLYLEVLDASFSFDGVVGAFAISSDIFIIAAGLGVGAMYVRSLTVYLVNKGTLAEYVYLEHGAHWAIGALATILLLTIKFHIPEIVTGLIGVGFILASFISSVLRNRRVAAAGGNTERTLEPVS